MFKIEIEATTLDGLKDKIAFHYNEFNKMREPDDILLSFVPAKEEVKTDIEKYTDVIEKTVELKQKAEKEVAGFAQNPDAKDSRGIKWDERIHNAKQRTNKKGEWLYVRGVDEELVNKIENNIQEITATVPPVPAIVDGVHATSPSVAPVQVEPLVAPIAPPPFDVSPARPLPLMTPAPVRGFNAFKFNVVSVMSELINAGKITPEYITSLKEYFKVKEIWEVFKNEDQLLELYNSFVSFGFVSGD